VAEGLRARVERVSDVGRYKVAKLDLGGLALNAVLPEDARLDGDETRIAFDPARLHLYLDGRIVSGEGR
jgi:glycerol transport system ATP-binding protein